jgi:hypothetical protein
LAGTRDALAYTATYYHHNYPIREEKQTLANPVGFYLVLWDNGEIEKVPYDQVLYVFEKPDVEEQGVTTFPVFPRQASVPYNSLIYEEFWMRNQRLTAPPVGKPIPTGHTTPIADNGGHEGLLVLSRLSDVLIERKTIWEVLGEEQENFSLQQIQTGAQKLGLPLQLRKLSLEGLEQLNTPALFLTTDDKRIVTLASLDNKEAIVVDRGLTRIVSRETLTQKYGGEALVPQAADNPSSVSVADPVRVLALQSKDEEVKQQVTITNRGKEPLTLQIERPIPGVTSAELSADTVAPGQSATLSLSIKWRDILKGDSQNVFVFLKTNDAVRPRLQLGFKLQMKNGAQTP